MPRPETQDEGSPGPVQAARTFQGICCRAIAPGAALHLLFLLRPEEKNKPLRRRGPRKILGLSAVCPVLPRPHSDPRVPVGGRCFALWTREQSPALGTGSGSQEPPKLVPHLQSRKGPRTRPKAPLGAPENPAAEERGPQRDPGAAAHHVARTGFLFGEVEATDDYGTGRRWLCRIHFK